MFHLSSPTKGEGGALSVMVNKPIKAISIEHSYFLACSFFLLCHFVILIPCSPFLLIKLSRGQLERENTVLKLWCGVSRQQKNGKSKSISSLILMEQVENTNESLTSSSHHPALSLANSLFVSVSHAL